MITKTTRIGNSRGIRIPRALLDLYGPEEGSQVDLKRTREGILIEKTPAREGMVSWSEAYAEMARDMAERSEWLEWEATAADDDEAVPSDEPDDQ